jgi:protein-L-isoaspartate(D-aspartate) O-methyltransferase
MRVNKSLVEYLEKSGYVKTERVKDAFLKTDRKFFIRGDDEDYSYADYPLPIGLGQTISAPHMVAIMTELLDVRRGDSILEIGSGSGYQAAILAQLCRRVYSIELEKGLVEFASSNLRKAGVKNVEVSQGDGSNGLPGRKFDKIILTCAAKEIPKDLISQLKGGGILLAPVGDSWKQELILLRKVKKRIRKENHGGCIFVPLRKG